MQVPILSGIGTKGADFTSAYAQNMVPVVKDTGISSGYLRPAPGIVTIADGGGANRGGYRWNSATTASWATRSCGWTLTAR
jgi:hypothetical protein